MKGRGEFEKASGDVWGKGASRKKKKKARLMTNARWLWKKEKKGISKKMK